jgi:uncharacterized protein with ATP-grasp and redox domains
MHTHYNSNDYSNNINKKVSKLENDIILVKKNLDNTLPTYNIKKKFDAHSHKLLNLEGSCFKIKDLPDLKREIRNEIMGELIQLGIVDAEEVGLNEPIEEENNNEIDEETEPDLEPEPA